MNAKTAAIIQARMSSKRLSNKVLKNIQGRPLLLRLVEQLSHSKLLDDIIIATSRDKSDVPICSFCRENEISYFRGSLDNVLKRYSDCAATFNVDIIVRVTADNPLIDPTTIDQLIEIFHKTSDIDYINNIHKNGLVHGAGCELVTKKALDKCLKILDKYEDKDKSLYLEHVTIFIRKHHKFFNIINYIPPTELSRNDLFFTVDYPEDIEVVNLIFKHLYRKHKFIAPKEVIDFLDKHPEIVKLNAHLHNPLPEW